MQEKLENDFSTYIRSTVEWNFSSRHLMNSVHSESKQPVLLQPPSTLEYEKKSLQT